MSLPFTVDQFLGVFARYNEAVWPAQVVLVALALVCVGLALRRLPGSDRAIAAILAFLWLWTGAVYHLLYFTTVNTAAYLFGAISIAQAAILVAFGVARPALSFRFRPTPSGLAGIALVVYALVVYPVLGYLLGHVYPHAPTFGLPCPTTIFTFGILLWADRRVPLTVLLLPLLWAGIGSSAAVVLGMTEDFGLAVAGVAAGTMIVVGNRRAAPARGHLSSA
jgi:hypothetical protein